MLVLTKITYCNIQQTMLRKLAGRKILSAGYMWPAGTLFYDTTNFIYALNNKKYNFINIIKNFETSLPKLFEILSKFLTIQSFWVFACTSYTPSSYTTGLKEI